MAAIPGANAPRGVPAWRAKVQRFWRWWSSELLGMVPERFASIAGSARTPLVSLDARGVTLMEPRPEGGVDRVETTEMDATRASAAMRELLARAGETRGRARLVLAPHEVLVRRVTMPAATEENLGAVLGFEMDRLTPFRSDEVYYDHRVVGRDSAAGTISVLVAVARREVVEARLAQARQLGLSVQGVAVREDSPHAGALLDVLPTAERGEREQPQERLAKQVLAGLALFLLLAALIVPAYRKRAEVVALKPAVEKAQAEAQATDTLVRELERLVGDYNFLLARKHGNWPTLAYIEETSRLLPDNTWLQQFEIKAVGKGREVLMSGETISSSRLIELLEQSKLLHNATPRGTVTRGTQPGTERFVIAAEVRPRPQPEASSIAQEQAPLAATPAYAPAVGTPVASPPPSAPVPQTATVVPVPSKPGDPGIIFNPRGRSVTPPEPQQRAPGK